MTANISIHSCHVVGQGRIAQVAKAGLVMTVSHQLALIQLIKHDQSMYEAQSSTSTVWLTA